MNQISKIKILNLLFFFILCCSPKDATFFKPPNVDVTEKSLEPKIFSDPQTYKESGKQGIVAFGIYRVESDRDSLRRAVLDKTMKFGIIPKSSAITFSRIKTTNEKPWVTEPISFENVSPVKDENRDGVSAKIRKVKEIIAFNIPEPDHKYVLSSISWYEHCGRYCIRNFTCTLDPEYSFQSIPIQSNKSKINFIGIYKIEFGFATEGNSSCYDHDRHLHFKVMPIITNGEPTILQEVMSNLVEEFYFGQQVEFIYAEIKFLRDLIEIQREGYWKSKAEERLNSLGYRFENGFLIEQKK